MVDLKESEENAAACRQIEHDMNETVVVCPYCRDERGEKFSCCGEVHFVEMNRQAYINGELVNHQHQPN